MGVRLVLLSAIAAAAVSAASAQNAQPTAAGVLARWRTAVHAEAAPRTGAAHRRAAVTEDGITRTDEVWVDRNGRYRRLSTSEFSSDDEVLVGDIAERRDWDGFVRGLDGTELERLHTEAFNASTLAFGPGAIFAHASVGEDRDHHAWTLTVTPPGGAQVTWSIDGATWLPTASSSLDGDGNRVTTVYSDWRRSGDVLSARALVSRGSDNGGTSQSVTSAAFERAPAATFTHLTPGPSDLTMSADAVRAPFTNEANHVVLQVSVNGRAPIGFILDTGDDTETLSTPRLAEMGVTSYGASQLVGGGNAAASSFARELTLTLPGAELRGQHGAVLDLSGLERALGVRIGGILGYDFISRFVLEIDYQNNVMTLHRRNWRYTGPGTTMPITFDGGIPRADVVLSVATKPRLPAHMIVDFGAADTMTLTAPFVAANDLIRLAGTNHTVFGSSGLEHQFFTQHNTRGRIDALHLNGLTLSSIPVSFSANTSGAYASASFAGTIGNGIYSRFRMIIDYGRRRIVFVPTPQSSAPFPDRTSFGVTLVAAGGDLHTYVVAGVRAGSPAETAGFHQDDVIAGIDDKSASQFALSELRAWLTQEGQHHIFHVVRGDARLDIAAAIHTVSIER